MKTMLAVLSLYKLEQWDDFTPESWTVDHEKKIILHRGATRAAFGHEAIHAAAGNLYDALSDEFYKIFDLPERWGHIGKRIGGGVVKLGLGALEYAGSAALAAAPEPTGLTKVGAVGAGIVATNTVVEGSSQLVRREGGIDLIGKAAGAYGRMVNGPQGEASSRYWIGWSQVFFGLAGGFGGTKVGTVALRELPAASKDAFKGAFTKMRSKFAPKGLKTDEEIAAALKNAAPKPTEAPTEANRIGGRAETRGPPIAKPTEPAAGPKPEASSGPKGNGPQTVAKTISCFPPETLVSTEAGLRSIAQIRAGERRFGPTILVEEFGVCVLSNAAMRQITLDVLLAFV